MKHIAIITGGTNNERDVSIKSAQEVFNSLTRQKYKVTIYDFPQDLVAFISQYSTIDFVRVVIHGVGGEDGQIIGLLDLLGLPYQCTSRDVMALTINKYLTKLAWKDRGLPVAQSDMLDRNMTREHINTICQKYDYQCVVKALGEGSSQGLIMINSPQQLDAIYDLTQSYDQVMCEQLIIGTEVTVAILDREILPIVEIIPPIGQQFDYENKYNGLTQVICPARLSDELTCQVQSLALQAYDSVGCTRYARMDIIIGPDGPILLEINTIPGFTAQSLFPLAAKTAGIEFDESVMRLME